MLIGNREMGGVCDLRVRAHRERRGQVRTGLRQSIRSSR